MGKDSLFKRGREGIFLKLLETFFISFAFSKIFFSRVKGSSQCNIP